MYTSYVCFRERKTNLAEEVKAVSSKEMREENKLGVPSLGRIVNNIYTVALEKPILSVTPRKSRYQLHLSKQ